MSELVPLKTCQNCYTQCLHWNLPTKESTQMPLLHNIAVSGSVAKSLVLYFLPVGAVFPWVEASIAFWWPLYTLYSVEMSLHLIIYRSILFINLICAMWLYIQFNNVWLYNSLIAYHIFNVRVSIQITNLEHICMESFIDHSFCILMVFAMSEKISILHKVVLMIWQMERQLNRQKEQTVE